MARFFWSFQMFTTLKQLTSNFHKIFLEYLEQLVFFHVNKQKITKHIIAKKKVLV